MDKQEIQKLKCWMNSLTELTIQFDGRDFFKKTSCEAIHVWQKLEYFEVMPELRRLLPDELNTAEAAKRLKEEIMTSSRFELKKPVLRGRHEVITPQGRLNLDTLEITPIALGENIFGYANFHHKKDVTWKDAPVFCQYVQTSLGVDLTDESDQGNGKRQLLLQILVYMLTDLWGTKKAIVLLGPASSGKTVLLDFIRFVVGEKGYTALSMEDLSDRFRSSLIEHASLVINDEIGAKIRNLDVVKKIISGEPVVVERKNGTPYTIFPNIKVCVAANALPRVLERDGEGAFAKRLQILQFVRAIPAERWVLNLSEKIIAERDVIMSCAIRESADFIAKPIFTNDADGAKLLAMYQRENDSVKAFLEDSETCKRGADEICLAEDFRNAYYAYCEAEGLPPIKKGLNLWLQQYGIRQERTRGDKYKNPRSHYRGVSLVRL